MTALIQVQDLTYTYPDGTSALNGIHLSVNQGEKVALVGPNGAGKSTFLLLLNGILQGEGLVQIDGLVLHRKNLNQIRAMVGVVFQNPDDQLFSPTVFEDVAFGPTYQGLSKHDIEHRVIDALQAVHMLDFIHRNPYHLSGGEKKRIAIATVLSMHPSILVLDEPTAGLDPRSRRKLIELLAELPQTMLIATHDLAMVGQLTPRMVIINHGQVIQDGSSESILQQPDLLLNNGLA